MYEAFGEKFPIQLKVDKYSMTGNLAIEMVNWKHRYPSSWAALTVDLNEVCEKIVLMLIQTIMEEKYCHGL